MTTLHVQSVPVRAPIAGREATRVLHLINGEHYSGAERVQDLLALRLPEFGYEASFVCLKPGVFAARRKSQEAPLAELPMTSRFALGQARKIARIAKSQNARILHAHTPRSLMLGKLASFWTGLPLVYHVHSPTLRDSTRQLTNRVNGLVERLCLTGDVRMIAVSQSLGRYLVRQGLPERRINVVPNGVPTTTNLPDRQPPARSWTIGMAALFRPRKGIEVLIEALALLRKQNTPVTLRAIGSFESAEYEQQVKRHAQSAGVADAINWVGFSNDVPAELARLDLFVLPSLFGEGLPMVVLEAMAAGAPVVATRVEGSPEAIRDSQDGVLVEPNSAQSLAAGIASFISGRVDWSQLRDSAWRRQRDSFSDQSMAAGVSAVYDQLCSS
jgi:glycosyltransferase involved in cell wall biosynthesis